MYLSVLWTLSFVSSGALALTYRLDTSYSGSKFFEEFDYFTVSLKVLCSFTSSSADQL